MVYTKTRNTGTPEHPVTLKFYGNFSDFDRIVQLQCKK